MNEALLAWNAAALLIYMTIAFVWAYQRKRLDTVDAAWGGGFVVAAWLVAGLELEFRTVLIAVLVDLWAIRLTHHLLNRVISKPKDDERYTEIAQKWNKKYFWPRAYVSVFLLQGLLILLISLPVVTAAGTTLDWAPALAVLGTVVWVKGFVVEAVADKQLRDFMGDKKNKGKVLQTGLWRRSRHPNYLGEVTQWFGIAIIACGASWGWVGLLGPVGLMLLIRFVSGVPPIEKHKANDAEYRAYMQRTNAILPKLGTS
ncbi:MAG TPA: DUF1295 domain-containing protein [Candidatus Saccharimonadales bacterium]